MKDNFCIKSDNAVKKPDNKTHEELDKKIDEESDDSFPASDPPANY